GRQGAGTAAAAVVAGVLGGMLPDVDHDHAVPCRETFTLLAAMVPAVTAPILIRRGVPHEWTIPYIALGYAVIRFPVAALFKRVTVHRGIFHSVPFLLLGGVLAALALRTYAPIQRVLLGGTVCAGALAHLLLDELFAVDFTGKRLKKSFGTAIKF